MIMEEVKMPGIVGFVEKHFNLIRKLELISFVIFIAGFLLYELKVDDSNIIFIIGIISTAVFIFLQAFKIIEFENLDSYNSYNILGDISFVNFIYKLYYISLSVSVVSLLGFVFDFRKGNTMAAVGGCSLIVILILTFLSKIQDKSKVYDLKFYLRILICFIFLGILVIEIGIIK